VGIKVIWVRRQAIFPKFRIKITAGLRHADRPRKCPLVGVDRKSSADAQNDAIDPTETLAAPSG
jgi:hypothetical protein